jgi:hypothetical protein
MKFLFLIFLLAACTKPTPKVSITQEDYVLIEFAARLEEDYHKMKNHSL